MNNVFISSEQDVISYCRNTDKGSMPASINVSDVRTGKLLVKVLFSHQRVSRGGTAGRKPRKGPGAGAMGNSIVPFR